MIGWQKSRFGRCDPVDREQVRPQVAQRFRRGAEGLENPELRIRRPGLEAGLVPVHRVPLQIPVALVEDPALGPRAVATLFRVGDLTVLPPQAIPREHAGPLRPDALEDRWDRLECFVSLDQPQCPLRLERLRERIVLVRKGDLTAESGKAVTEAAV